LKKVLICGAIYDTPSGPSGQGGKLFTVLKKDGYIVYKKSKLKNKILRPIDIALFLILQNKKYDIVIIQVASYKSFLINALTLIIAKMLNKRTISVIMGGAFTEFYDKYPRFVSQMLNKSTTLISPSKFIGDFLISKKLNVQYVPNFIDVSKFRYLWKPTSSLNLLWVRAFHDIYKPELAINAIHQLKDNFPDIKLTMIGPDLGKLSFCKNLIKSLNLSDQIQILGPISNNLLNSIFSSHSIYLNTTSYESFGDALVEAACSGIPIVSTKVGEIPLNWVHNKELIMVEDNNLQELVIQIINLLNDPTFQLELSLNARKKAENFDWANIRNSWHQLLS
jgi:glycosyltransferase involved in cell wall biosynthesis